MKKLLSIAPQLALAAGWSFFLFVGQTGLAQSPIEAAASLQSVIVYPDGAVVTRQATVDLPVGESTVFFADLPPGLLTDSLQGEAAGPAGLTLLDLRLETRFRPDIPDPRSKELHDQLQELQRQDRDASDVQQSLNDKRATLKKIQDYYLNSLRAGKDAAPPPKILTTEEWRGIQDYVDGTSAEALEKIRQMEDLRADLANRIQAVVEQLNKLAGSGRRSTTGVAVRLTATQAGRAQVAISCRWANASWTPAYDARYSESTRSVELTYYGVVRQSTGEDWNNVKLTLSTARPSLGGAAPELPVWRVEVAQPVAYRQGNYMLKSAERAAGAAQVFNQDAKGDMVMPSENEMAPLPASLAVAEVQTGATSATFEVAAPSSVASDNEPRKVPLAQFRLAARLQYQAVPKLIETAYLGAYVKNNSEYPLLAGPVAIFMGSALSAHAQLKTVMPGEEFELPLGADEGISIKRKLVNKFTEDTGLTSKYVKHTYEYLITVQNNKKSAEKILFKDQTPVSAHEKITVKILSPAEKDADREKDGKLVWHWDLAPGAKRETTLKFSVEYPAGTLVSGL